MDTKPIPDNNNGKKIPIQTVERLSIYRKILEELHDEGVTHIYSHQLAGQVGVTPAQLRRDLASFGSFGNISKGYNVYQMILTISRLLGTDRIQSAALIGMGNLGRAILAYRGFEERGFHVAVVFDMDSEKVGRVFAGRRCFHLNDLETVLRDYQATIAILACGSQGLQSLVERLGKAGVRGVINFVPKKLQPVKGMYIEDIDIAAKMEKISFLVRTNPNGAN